MSITEFLLARLAEDENREVEDDFAAWSADFPEEYLEAARQAHAKLASTQFLRLSRRIHAAGYACSPDFICRKAAARYAEHPDYRDEWRP